MPRHSFLSFLLFVFPISPASPARAVVRLPSLIGDDMMLQQSADAGIWG